MSDKERFERQARLYDKALRRIEKVRPGACPVDVLSWVNGFMDGTGDRLRETVSNEPRVCLDDVSRVGSCWCGKHRRPESEKP